MTLVLGRRLPTRGIFKSLLLKHTMSGDLGYENHPTLYTRQGHNGIEGQDTPRPYEERGYGR